MALSVEIKVSYAEATLVKEQSWYENPMGVAFNIRAPLAPPPQQEEPKSEGRCPNNPLWTTRFTTNSENTWYPCYSKLSSDGKVDSSNDCQSVQGDYQSLLQQYLPRYFYRDQNLSRCVVKSFSFQPRLVHLKILVQEWILDSNHV